MPPLVHLLFHVHYGSLEELLLFYGFQWSSSTFRFCVLFEFDHFVFFDALEVKSWLISNLTSSYGVKRMSVLFKEWLIERKLLLSLSYVGLYVSWLNYCNLLYTCFFSKKVLITLPLEKETMFTFLVGFEKKGWIAIWEMVRKFLLIQGKF